MRHSRSLSRALSRPPRIGARNVVATTRPKSARPPDVGRATGPDGYARCGPGPSTGPPTRGAAPARRPDTAWALGLAAAVAVGAATVSLLADPDPLAGALAAVGALLVAAPVVLHPHLADRALAALLGLVVLPVALLVALVVRSTSRGPVLTRAPADSAGEPGSLRFRTTPTADRSEEAAARTPVGRLLHRLSLDELPRLLDVARGDAPLLRRARH